MLHVLTILPILACAAPLAPPAPDTPRVIGGGPNPVPRAWPRLPPPPGDTQAASPSPEEARIFAAQVVSIAEEISRLYVRPVSRRELLAAALTGLFEEARQPLPDDLAADVGRLTSDVTCNNLNACATIALQTQPFPAVGCSGFFLTEPLFPVRCIDDSELLTLLAQARLDLGDVEPLHAGNDLRVAIQGMLRCLDPYCALVSSDDVRRGGMEATHYGCGMVVAAGTDGKFRVASVDLGGPAQQAGVRPGDFLTRIDGNKTSEMSSVHLAGEPGTNGITLQAGAKMKFTLRRPGADHSRTVTLEYLEYTPELVLGVRREECGTWDYWVDREHKIAQVRIGALDQGTVEQLTRVLGELRADGMRGLILDVRWSPGGLLLQATRTAGLFIKEGVVCKTRAKDDSGKWQEEEYKSRGIESFLDFPLVVLVNGETSGGAELIAAALEDYHRAVIVGQRTLGKASIQIQKVLPLANAGLKLTSGSFIRPSGKGLHRFADSRIDDDWGVRPSSEHETPLSADLSRQLREWWLQQSLRPGGDNAMLPLDDPENDPQRQAALRVLEGMMSKEKH